MHLLWLGLLIGWGAAIPIGPVNLEITRRHLNHGMACGLCTGLGACSADLTYLFLLALGVLGLLKQPEILRGVGLLGSLLLLWFAYQALKNKSAESISSVVAASLLKNWSEGYGMTLFNPYTILFWASLSSQVALISAGSAGAIWRVSLGVLLGTVSWVLGLNACLYLTKHRITPGMIGFLNRLGGIILLLFALFGLFRVFVPAGL